ncbi:hypothetical protein KCV07_g586, partial [Aureobasidium melanogenum]
MANNAPLCRDYHLGQCLRGSRCSRSHPANLDPNLPKEIDYQVCNELGQGCRRCLEQGLRCDKKDRDHDDPMDPCSECRHFGGPGYKCILAQNTTRNDMLYPIMLNGAAREPEYSLPKFKGRDEPKKGGRIPSPMLANEVKPNWTGASRDELLVTPDMLPPQVRRHPRAYLVPPGESTTKRKRREWHACHPPSDDTASTAMFFNSPPVSTQHAVAGLAQSSANRPQGPIISTTIHWPTNQLMKQYSSGHTVISPSMRYASYPMAQAMPPAWIPQSMTRPIGPLPINRGPNTRYAGYSSGQGMSQAHMPRPSVHPRPTMSATTLSAANTRYADRNEPTSDIVDPRPAKRSRTEDTATTTRTKEWVQDIADINDTKETMSEFSVSTMWRP